MHPLLQYNKASRKEDVGVMHHEIFVLFPFSYYPVDTSVNTHIQYFYSNSSW